MSKGFAFLSSRRDLNGPGTFSLTKQLGFPIRKFNNTYILLSNQRPKTLLPKNAEAVHHPKMLLRTHFGANRRPKMQLCKNFGANRCRKMLKCTH